MTVLPIQGAKAAQRDARDRQGKDAESEADGQGQVLLARMEEVVLR
jgi:hypothetical protein